MKPEDVEYTSEGVTVRGWLYRQLESWCCLSDSPDDVTKVRIDPQRLEFTNTNNRATDGLIQFHDAAHLLRSLPEATVSTTVIDAITTMISDSTAAGPTGSHDQQ